MEATKRPWTYRANSRQRVLNTRDYVEICDPGGPLGIYAFLRPGEPKDDIETQNFHDMLLAVNHFEEIVEAAENVCLAVRAAPVNRLAVGVDEDLAIRTQYFMREVDRLSALLAKIKEG